MNAEPTVLLRTNQVSNLLAKGIDGYAAEICLKETAGERHASRVDYARWAAEQWYYKEIGADATDDCMWPYGEAAAGAILWADLMGIGGTSGVQGLSTTRHPAFSKCGKGRKQATDGGAWSSAIRDAALLIGGCFTAYKLDDGGCVAAFKTEGVLMDICWMPVEWMLTIAREGLRRQAGVKRWHPEPRFSVEPDECCWAEFINQWQATIEPVYEGGFLVWHTLRRGEHLARVYDHWIAAKEYVTVSGVGTLRLPLEQFEGAGHGNRLCLKEVKQCL